MLRILYTRLIIHSYFYRLVALLFLRYIHHLQNYVRKQLLVWTAPYTRKLHEMWTAPFISCDIRQTTLMITQHTWCIFTHFIPIQSRALSISDLCMYFLWKFNTERRYRLQSLSRRISDYTKLIHVYACVVSLYMPVSDYVRINAWVNT